LRGDRDYRVDSFESRHNQVVVAFSWVDEEGRRHEWAQALRLKDGKIVDMRDFAKPRSALTLMRLRSTFGWAR